jgi:sugar transferase (PEP-CTERM/EpsH1 system associated)
MQVSPGKVPLVAHIIYRLDIGGLENGLVNLLNQIPPQRYRHAIICLTDYNSAFRQRIQQPAVAVHALHKRPGQDWGLYLKLWRLLWRLRPAIVHSRNLAALEGQLPAALAGVRARVHSEHGWDVMDPDGSKYLPLRRWFRPLVSRYIALSGELEEYLCNRVQVPRERVNRICNGVDSACFRPAPAGRAVLPLAGFAPPGTVVIGTVGRMERVKDQLTLVRAFLQLLQAMPDGRARLRLVLVGEGPLRSEASALLEQADASHLAWLPGAREDVPELLRCLDIFVLPSLAEGISNTILEAMASGLPVVATRVGGNAELVVDGESGWLVPPADPQTMALALRRYSDAPTIRHSHGAAARQRIERHFSLTAMKDAYMAVYDAVLDAVSHPLSMRH